MLASPDPVYTFRDLEAWTPTGVELAVLGFPIGHSVSPLMHNAALTDLALSAPRFSEWRYVRFEIEPSNLPRALEFLYLKKFRGLNLTVPHKMLACDLIGEIDDAARPVGAVNTLLSTDRGWRGYNTDGYGLATALKENLSRDLAGASILLLGAGGAACGAAVECLQRKCAALWIGNRSQDPLNALLLTLEPISDGIPVRGFTTDSLPKDLPGNLLVINATSSGLNSSDPAPIDLRGLRSPAAVFDMIYNPPQTALLRQAEALGLPFANGLSMLVHQGAKALEIWSNVPAARTAPIMSRAVNSVRRH